MRLGDLDALKNIFEEHEDRRGDLDCDWRILIDNAPTVEVPNYAMGYQDGVRKVLKEVAEGKHRPQGRWIQTEIIDDDSEYGVNDDASECSNCKHIESSHYWTTTYYHYCPNCGASMGGKEE